MGAEVSRDALAPEFFLIATPVLALTNLMRNGVAPVAASDRQSQCQHLRKEFIRFSTLNRSSTIGYQVVRIAVRFIDLHQQPTQCRFGILDWRPVQFRRSRVAVISTVIPGTAWNCFPSLNVQSSSCEKIQ